MSRRRRTPTTPARPRGFGTAQPCPTPPPGVLRFCVEAAASAAPAERKSVANGNAQRQPSPEASRRIAGGRAPQDLTESSRKARRRENHRIGSRQRTHPGRDAGLGATNRGTPRTPAWVRFSSARFPVLFAPPGFSRRLPHLVRRSTTGYWPVRPPAYQRNYLQRRGWGPIAHAFVVAIVLSLTLTSAIRAQTLDDAIIHALAHSPDLRVLEASVAEARANATLADPFAPSASVSTTPGYASGLPTAVLGQLPAIGTIEAHRLLYDPSAHVERLSAAADVDAAVARLEARRREVAQSVGELYGRLVAGDAIITSAQRRVAANETIASRTEALEKEGRARTLDVDRATLQLATARRHEAQARARQALDRTRYSSLVGDAWSPPSQTSPPESVARDAAAENGDVAAALAADSALRAFDARIDTLQRALVAVASFWQPSVAAQVQYSRLFDRFGRYYNNFTPNDLSIGASITLPLWTGGRRAAKSARVAAQLEQLKAEREARRAQLELAIREATADASEARADSELARRSQVVAQEGLRIAEELARVGRGDANDVPAAQIALADAEDEGSNALAHLIAVVARLKLLRGELPHPPI